MAVTIKIVQFYHFLGISKPGEGNHKTILSIYQYQLLSVQLLHHLKVLWTHSHY